MVRSRSQKAVEKRVQRFLADYDAQWRAAAPAFERRDPASGHRDAFEAWGARTARVREEHFTADTTEEFRSFGRPPEYGVAVERIVRSEVVGEKAYVLTEVFSHPLDMFHEFTLVPQGGEWRIRAIAQHFEDPTLPFASADVVQDALAGTAVDAPWDPMPAAQSRLDEQRNFTDRAVSSAKGETTEARVNPVGTLVTRSGALAVLDFGYDNDDARPLAHRVPPGSYPVERVTAFGRNAAVRVRFSDRMPVAWHPASLPGSGHVIGVDAGCACIVDYPAYAQMTRRAKAEAFDDFLRTPHPVAFEVPLGDGDGDVGVAAESGHGDGSYPVYWGVDEAGGIVQLVVDFLVLAAEDDDGVLVHL
ncbi:DUF4241 domain-containing protein [Microbacterium binotii]|jgi:hypothetical protein|uniref:DUF4241 domain-containing protein n=1 Tax=Microbacterium binotii TaxID=462710 RepID=A0ABN3P7R5_9MICO